MKFENYYVGLDIGTDSVGYAVTDERYNLCKFKGEPMWGVTLFDAAETAEVRRLARSARRRLDRRQQRVQLLMELFAEEISKIDERFFVRIKESQLYPETDEQKVRLFGSYDEQKEYLKKYPTIHHLIVELMNSDEPHDARLVYIACAWLVAHRGHFLNEVDKNNIEGISDFSALYDNLVSHITRDGYSLPWGDVDINEIARVLKEKQGITKKSKALAEVLFKGGKAPKVVSEAYEYNYDLVIKLLCGGTVKLKDLFDKDEYGELEEKSVALNMEDEKLAIIMQSIGDDAELIVILRAIYDWAVLIDILKGQRTISDAKVLVYEEHKEDLKLLKTFIRKYIPEKYNEIFRSKTNGKNYVAYIGSNHTANNNKKVKKLKSKEEFCKYILSIVKNVTPMAEDEEAYKRMISRLELYTFLPKQVDGDNRVIPYQLYWYELNKILEKAKAYIPFLSQADEDGITGCKKVLSIIEYRVPYYVGPLKTNPNNNRKLNHWMVRKAEGRIYPWNFDKIVDLDASENAFIDRMTNSCTYIPGEDVLPKNSLVYSAFEVLNEINNIKINGNDIPVSVKQKIYENVFMANDKVIPKSIRQYLEANGYASADDIITGIDEKINSSLKPYRAFTRLIRDNQLTYADVERVISRATYSEDKGRFKEWLTREYPNLEEEDVKYICRLKFKEFGRLSRKLLCGIEGTNKETGETYSIIRAMWETNNNIMQLLSDRFTFKEAIDELVKEYYEQNPRTISERLEEMYVSNAVKRPIIRTLDILKDIVKVCKREPKMIFVEMARGANEDEKNKRKASRLEQIKEIYKKIDSPEIPKLLKELDNLGDSANNRLQSDKLFLYFIQLGKCLYTGKPINLEFLFKDDSVYNIEHIYPRSFVKDDSIINNKILVDSKANAEKSDKYPIDSAIQEKMRGFWSLLHSVELLSDEKYKRLIRNTHFTDDEKFEFINRQLVETRQSTKVITALLGEIYPSAEIVYVKAGLVSDFREKFRYYKSRLVNDLHHAKDAYLNIVVGSVWHHKFSRRYYVKNADNNVKAEIVFTRPVWCGEKTIWNGAEDKNRILGIVKKNNIHLSKYAFCRKGGFFDQMPLSASEGLTPRKKNLPTEIYGGYNKTTASFFVLVKYKAEKKSDVVVMPVELLCADKFLSDDDFARAYAIKTIGDIVNKPIYEVEFLFNKRVIKINTILSLNGFRACISGKGTGGTRILLSCFSSFKVSREVEMYIKKLESFEKKLKDNPNIECNEAYSGISKEKNLVLYDLYIDKLLNSIYKYRLANPVQTLINGRELFEQLTISKQVNILLSVQGLLGREKNVDLRDIGGAGFAGDASISSNLSNLKKNYTDVRIVDISASGLFETVSDNLLDLL